MQETILIAKENLPTRFYFKELIELLFEQPYCKVKYLVDIGIAKRQTAAEYLTELEKFGILTSQKVGLENLYLKVKLVEVLKKIIPFQPIPTPLHFGKKVLLYCFGHIIQT